MNTLSRKAMPKCHFERNKVKSKSLIDLSLRTNVKQSKKKRISFKSAHGALWGFTLVEVLLTLVIIGVVAALTIPGFIAEHQKHTYIAGLKKAYSTGNQVLLKIAYERCGSTDISCIFPGTPNIVTIGNTISSGYSLNKNCSYNKLPCLAKQAWDYTGTTVNSLESLGNTYSFQTADSMGIVLNNFKANCGLDASLTAGSPTEKVCGEFWVDVNGTKGPNAFGRDTFRFYITSNKAVLLYPFGGRETNPGKAGTIAKGGDGWWHYNNLDRCGTNSNVRGYFCAGRVMEKGWEMDY